MAATPQALTAGAREPPMVATPQVLTAGACELPMVATPQALTAGAHEQGRHMSSTGSCAPAKAHSILSKRFQ